MKMKQKFIRELAEYLVGDQALMSIKLSMGDPAAQRWASYPTVDEAERVLAAWLGT